MGTSRDTAEQHFVREALLALGSERAGLREAARGVRNWDRVLAVAAAGSVTESIGSALALREVEEEIPEPARTAFREAHAGATARNALLLVEAADVQAAFAAEGIDSVILKGPGLLVAHYPDIGSRHVSDVDILVRPSDAARAEGVARARGGRPEVHALVPMEEGEGAHHHLTPLVGRSGVILEIHTRLPGQAAEEGDIEAILSAARTVNWQGRAIRIPASPDLAAMLCLHVFTYHGGLEEYRARHLADITVLMGAGAVRWEEVEARVEKEPDRAAVRMSRVLLDGTDDGLRGWRYVVGVRAGGWWKLLRRRDPGALLAAVFPPRDFMAGRYHVHPESKLLPLLYLWRPVRGAWRFVTGR